MIFYPGSLIYPGILLFLLVSASLIGVDSCSGMSLVEKKEKSESSSKKIELFLTEMFSENDLRLHSFPSFSQDGFEVFFAVIPPAVMYSRKNNGIWSKPEIAPFSSRNIQAPFVDYSNNKIYFQMTQSTGYGSTDIWFVNRNAGDYSKAINPGSPPNTIGREGQPTLTEDGHLYFIGYSQNTGWNQGIYRSKKVNGKYGSPELLPYPVNSPYIDAYPFISPDERFLLFSSSRPEKEEKDLKLFLCFRDENDKWQTPLNISEKLGLKSAVRFPCLSPDQKFIYFLMDNKFYRLDTSLIKEQI